MPRGHVHQQVYSWRCQEAVYINADVLIHEYGLVNHSRRQWAASGIHNRTSKRECTFGRALVAGILPRFTALEMQISMQICRDAYLVSASPAEGIICLDPETATLLNFYRAMHLSAKRGIAIACRLSVRPSVCDVGEL